MALPTSNISLSAIEAEASATSLNGAGINAGFTSGGTYMSEFFGWSAFTPPSSGSYVNFNDYYSNRGQFIFNGSNCKPHSYWEMLQFPYSGSGNEAYFPAGWDGSMGTNGYCDFLGNFSASWTNYDDVFWWPRIKGLDFYLQVTGTDNNAYYAYARVTNNYDRTIYINNIQPGTGGV